MTSRECIIAALEHRESDHLPIDFAGTDCSSIHLIAYDKLRKHLGIEPRSTRMSCLTQVLAVVEDQVQDCFHADAKALYFNPAEWTSWDSGWGFEVEAPARWRPEELSDGRTVIRDANGVIRYERPVNGYYFDPISFVFSDILTPDEFNKFPDIFDRWDWSAVYDESIDNYAKRAKELYTSTDQAIVASWRMHYLQAGQIMRGYEQFMIDLMTDEPLVHGMMDRLHASYLKRAESFLAVMADYTDIIFFTDDLGTQNNLLISPKLYRKLIKPYWTELIALVKKYDKKVLMHSCGAVSELIPDFIEMGIDALNPVQITAAGMAPERLKKEFGKDITFWGGGISTQGVMDRGTPEQINDEVKRNIDTFAPGGGFVFTQVHNIQYDVSPENIVVAYQTAYEY